MAITRVFLDWTEPALPAAADFLLRGRIDRGMADLRPLIVAVPTGWAARRLLEILAERAERQAVALVPPQIVTIGELPELLYEPKFPFADALTQQLAWIQALRAMPADDVRRIIRHLPPESDHFSWLALGEMLAALHRELAGDGLDFSHVVEHTRQMAGANEVRRWRTLHEVQKRYHTILDGLKLWDRQTARLVAVEYHEFHTTRPIVLIGMVDLNRAQRQILDQVAEHVTALVIAPPGLADRFDPYGGVIPEAWKDQCISRVFERTELVDGPGDQALAVGRALADLGGKYAAEEIVIGVPDERVVPYVRQRLEECGVPVRHGAGQTVGTSGPARLLRAVSEYLATGRFPAFASLIRHPAVERWLTRQRVRSDWITQLDTFYGNHLPTRLLLKRLKEADGCEGLCAAFEKLSKLLRDLSGPARPLKEWSGPILDLLVALFGRKPLDHRDPQDHALLIACDKLREALRGLEQLKDALAPRVNGAEALRLLLREAASEPIPPPASEAAVEMLGWLDLPLDDAPALIVTGFNEGIVPASRNGDVFLPNQLRQQLGLEDNDRRYGRDAYFLSLLAASRRELTLIAGRRTAEHDPLIPSRLLFACDDGELPRRVLRMFERPEQSRRFALPGGLRPGRTQHAFDVPRPVALPQPVTRMRVTEFADYLACPYRYYLRRRLDLQSPDTQAEELPPPAFGNALHAVLEEFAHSDERLLTDPNRILEFLSAALDNYARRLFGEEPLPAVRVQIEQVRHRLKAFAGWQARWAALGWRIERAEHHFKDDSAFLPVDGEPMYLRGRIDRIDVLETSRGVERVVFDYKTGESGTDPERKHRRGDGQWTDLQLPLYRHLVRSLGIDGPLKLGYILLPKDTTRTGQSLAEWTDDDLADADRMAADVVRGIRLQKFWPPRSDAPFFDEFAAICHENLYGPSVSDDEE